MATFAMTDDQLKELGYHKPIGKYLLFPRKGWHIRIDQKRGNTADHLISSFHVKRDNNSSFICSDESDEDFGKKINVEESNYVYFVYAGSGVWQPIWGYDKSEQKIAGKTFWKGDNTDIDMGTWGFACDKAREFLRKMTRATPTDHGLAMGPIQAPQANVFYQL